MRRSLAHRARCCCSASSHVAFPVRSETFQSNTPPFAIDYPKGWKIRDGEGGLATRAVGPGSAMNVSVAAASRPDLDADRFSDADLDRIADEPGGRDGGRARGLRAARARQGEARREAGRVLPLPRRGAAARRARRDGGPLLRDRAPRPRLQRDGRDAGEARATHAAGDHRRHPELPLHRMRALRAKRERP